MKNAVSISLGSSKRDKSVKVNLNGREILVERVGTSMMEAALTLYSEKGRRLTDAELNS